jgi:phosphoglycerol transferase
MTCLFAILAMCLLVLMRPAVSFWSMWPFIITLYGLALVLCGRCVWARFSTFNIVLLVAAFVLLPFAVVMRMFGYVDFFALHHHVRAGLTSDSFVESRPALVQSLCAIFFYFVAVYHLGALLKFTRTAAVTGALALWTINPTIWAALAALGVTVQPLGLGARITPPALVSDAARPDIVLIYLEGFERGYTRRDLFGDAYEPLQRLADTGVELRNIKQIEGTGWTLAGIVASQCGLPLLPNSDGAALNLFTRQTDFLPHHTCLGDVLKDRGYWLEYHLGNDRRFAGNDHFVKDHGFDRIIDLESYAQVFPAAEYESALYYWVVDDQLVLDHARARYDDLAARADPFMMMVQTFGPHGPRHLVSRKCRPDGTIAYLRDMAPAASCLAEQVEAFVHFVQDHPAARETVFVLMSDHLGHDPRLRDMLAQDTRRNTAILIREGGPTGAIDRSGATIDLYPTILDMLGWLGDDGRAGLGVSRLRDQPSLTEELGPDGLNHQLRFDASLRDAIWSPGAQVTASD